MTQGRGPAGGQAPCGRARHIPVLLYEVLRALGPRVGELYVDATFGGGGYSRAILEAAQCHVLAIDRDPAAVARGSALVREFAPRLTLVCGRFAELDRLAFRHGVAHVNGVVFDIGVSSFQLDDPARGFSFQTDGPLDMRMGEEGPTAAHVVNTAGEEELANILFRFGEERRARAIARAVVAARARAPILRTLELADIVKRVLGPRPLGGIHPATRTFQALRIYVNRELEELAQGLCAAERCLAPEGRLVAVTFHSLEDRIVKDFLTRRSGRIPQTSRHSPAALAGVPLAPPPSFRLVNSRPLTPSENEQRENPRSRTAKLRAAVRTAAPPWPGAEE